MFRRFILAGLAAALAAPVFAITPASAAVLFSCPAIDSGGISYLAFIPGLSHTQTAQSADFDSIRISTPCSNGETASILVGAWGGFFNPVTTFGPRPLGCPVAWGGAGPDYPDQKPVLFGATDPSFGIDWSPLGSGPDSTGIAKVKQGAAGDQLKVVLNITAGKYAPPVGKKTKIKLTANITPYPGFSFSCANNTDPLEFVALTSVGSVIVNQK